jgi:hypothetical protein
MPRRASRRNWESIPRCRRGTVAQVEILPLVATCCGLEPASKAHDPRPKPLTVLRKREDLALKAEGDQRLNRRRGLPFSAYESELRVRLLGVACIVAGLIFSYAANIAWVRRDGVGKRRQRWTFANPA